MVTGTSREDTLRVSFVAPQTDEARHAEMEVVCFLRVTPTGMDVVYSHTIVRTREGSVGPFSNSITMRQELTPQFCAVIEVSVMHELWKSFFRRVVSLEAEKERDLGVVPAIQPT